MANESTRHMIVDLKTGFSYGIKLDAEGKCTAVQPLNTNVETLEGKLVQKFGPLVSAPGGGLRDPQTLPYGKTTYCVELSSSGAAGSIFTVVWPSKKDADAGVLPTIAKAALPDDLVKARIAPAPNGPHFIGTLRRAYRLALPCARVPCLTIDGQPTTRGVYRPTAADRRRIARILAALDVEGAA